MTDTLNAVERTALLTAALRAAETARPDRLYSDPFARDLAGDLGMGLLGEIRAVTFPADRDRTVPSTPDYNAIRSRFFDDLLSREVTGRGIRQVVLAPAGMDSRAYRLDWPGDVKYFELDRPEVLAYKAEKLAGARPAVADHRTVAADLVTDDWESGMRAAGYEPGEPAVWLLEGLLYYLPEAETRKVLARVAGFAGPRSRIAADVVNAAALTLPNMTDLLEVFAGWGCPWLFGTDEPEALFAEYGMSVEATQPGEPGADYGRWPDPVPPRRETGVRRVFFVHGWCHE